jgi:hypothetical protein
MELQKKGSQHTNTTTQAPEVGKRKNSELRGGDYFHSPKSSRLVKHRRFSLTYTQAPANGSILFLRYVEGVNGFLSIPHLVQRAILPLCVFFLTLSRIRFIFRMQASFKLGSWK